MKAETKAAHTPGPWHRNVGPKYPIYVEGCDCADRSWYGAEHDSACPLAGQPNPNSMLRMTDAPSHDLPTLALEEHAWIEERVGRRMTNEEAQLALREAKLTGAFNVWAEERKR